MITNLKISIVPKKALLVESGYFGRLFENYFKSESIFFNRFLLNFNTVILICNIPLFLEILIFGFTRGGKQI